MSDASAGVVQDPLPLPPGSLPASTPSAPSATTSPSSSPRPPARARRWSRSSPSTPRSPAAAASRTPRRSRRCPTRSTPTSAGSSARTRSGSSPATSRSTPRAPVIVMTTEILRNMFYTGGLAGLESVVLDECHYMGDEGRGTVWEEIIVNAPQGRGPGGAVRHRQERRRDRRLDQLVHRPIVPITHPHRPRAAPVPGRRSVGRDPHATMPCGAARCACSVRRARAATTTGGAGTRGAWSTPR